MARVINTAKIMPLAMITAPVMIKAILVSKKPINAAAKPDMAFKREIIIGISAPPIGSVRVRPKTNAVRLSKRTPPKVGVSENLSHIMQRAIRRIKFKRLKKGRRPMR